MSYPVETVADMIAYVLERINKIERRLDRIESDIKNLKSKTSFYL